MSFDDPLSPTMTNHEISLALREASARAAAEGDATLAEQYDVASRVTFLMTRLDSPGEPFMPMIVTALGSSGSLADFTPEDIVSLEHVVAETSNETLRARVADVLWLIGPKEKRFEYAKQAIAAYEKHPIDGDSWYSEGDDAMRRAMHLARRLGKPLAETHERLAKVLESAIVAASAEDKFLPVSMAGVLWDEGRGQVSAAAIAAALGRLSAEAEAAGDIYTARGVAIAAGQWFGAAEDAEGRFDQIDRVADLWIAEAKGRGGLVAAVLLQDALQTLRQIPRASRPARGTNERIADTVRLMQAANEDALAEMHPIDSGPIDISDGVRSAENLIRGKSGHDALSALALGFPVANVAETRERAIKSIQEHPLSSLFQTTHIAPDGRVIHKTPGAGDDDKEANIHRQMMHDHGFRVALVTQTFIAPALLQLRSEHQPNLADFERYCRESGFVPLDRVRLFAKGLYFGFELDLGVAVHLLAPQLENAIRQHLKAAGVLTTTVDEHGIEMEIGLTNLMERPEAEVLLGPDLSFEIRAIFTDQLGPNLRNDVAHGLVGDNIAGAASGIYAWWLCLKIVMTGFWNRVLAAEADGAETAAATEDPPEAGE